VLNGVPLWRSARGGNVRFECAGLYAAEPAPYGISLKPTKGYKGPRPDLVLYPQAKEGTRKSKGPKGAVSAQVLEFKRANLFGGSPWARLSDEVAVCPQRLELPAASVLTWNTQDGPTADKQFRLLMTELTPRGALLRSGAANLGELLSAPIPRSHPGYNPQVLVRPFSMEQVSDGLDGLGYQRKRADAPRLDKNGRPLKLAIGIASSSVGLAEKVLADAFTAVGIAADFVPKGRAKGPLSGALAGVKLDWPDADLLLSFHSRGRGSPSQTYPFWPLADKELDRALEAYTRSLTTATPDFGALAKVHARLFDLEPVTVLMQHEACVEASPSLAARLKSLNIRDPDWFRRLIL
jgi:hypothetical protein